MLGAKVCICLIALFSSLFVPMAGRSKKLLTNLNTMLYMFGFCLHTT